MRGSAHHRQLLLGVAALVLTALSAPACAQSAAAGGTECADDVSWAPAGRTERTRHAWSCSTYAAGGTNDGYCSDVNIDGVAASIACPVACGTCDDILGDLPLTPPADSGAASGTDPLAALVNRAGIFFGDDAACQSAGPLLFASPKTVSVPSQSGVSVRFQLRDPCGQPLPFLAPSQFSAQAGPLGRHIGNGPHDEGALAVGGVQLSAVDASAQYITLLVDGSISMDWHEEAQVLSAFVASYGDGSGATYMRIVAFQGHTSRLTLTSECPGGFCDDVDTLHRVITEMQTSLDNWEDGDPEASAVYYAIIDTVDELGVLMRAHADVQPQDDRAVRTSDSLVIFTDLDEDTHRATLESTLATIDAVHPSIGSVSMVLFEPDVDDRDTRVIAAIEAAKQSFSDALGADFVVNAADASQLQVAFQAVADTVNAEANSWYEIFVCPPQRAGTQELVISVEGYDGSLTTTFDATGFSNTCPFHFQSGVLALEQLTETEFCDGRGCGFYDGVFCGICPGPTAQGSSYTIHEEHESLLLRYAQGSTRPAGLSFASNLGSVHITAHVGTDHRLVKSGDPPVRGVTVESDGVFFDITASQHPTLVHVTPPAGGDDGEHTVTAELVGGDLSCASGTFVDLTTASCVSCSAGTYQSAASHFETSCIECAAGMHSSSTGQSSCISCEAGKYAVHTSSSTCTSCESGRTTSVVGSDSAASCESIATCQAGYYLRDTATQSACARCSRGKYQSASSHREGSCIDCPANTYNTHMGSTHSGACSSCGDGRTSPAGSEFASQCTNPSPSPGTSSTAGSIAASPRAAWFFAVALCLMRVC
eukprot:COSAG06_NODE_2103_length_7590_cov_3.824723_4_plen_823_part_00